MTSVRRNLAPVADASSPADPTPMPPTAAETDERAVVGSAIIATRDIRTVMLSTYKNCELTDPRCMFVDALMRRMDAEGVPTDQVSIAQYARRNGEISDGAPRIALASFVAELAQEAPVPLSGTWHAAVLVENAARRRVLAAGLELTRIAQHGSLDQLAVITAAECAAAAELVARAQAAAA